MAWEKLFKEAYRIKIQRVLPILFHLVELENKRGNKLGMEVGTARERVIIALLMYVYGQDSIEFPPSTSAELDVIVEGSPLSIKTKSNKGFSGVKLIWTVDRGKIKQFVKLFKPQSDLLYINVIWNKDGKFFLIPRSVQEKAITDLGRDRFFKLPKQNTNPRGVELSGEAMQYLQENEETKSINIFWKREPSLLGERSLYRRWIDLWDTL